MDNKNGGQSSSSAPGMNTWGQTAAKNAAHLQQQTPVSSAQKQQMTAAELARQKVLDAYKKHPQSHQEPAKKQQATTGVPQINTDDWRKYHSAWQDYYQKYYGEYYGKAAKEYVAKERLRIERDVADREAKARSERQAIMSAAASVERQEEKEARAKVELQLNEMSKLAAGVVKKSSQDEVLKAVRTFVNKSKQKTSKKRTLIKEMVLEFTFANGIVLPDEMAATVYALDDEPEVPTVVNVNAGGINVQQANTVRP
jgi:hypothetical protein